MSVWNATAQKKLLTSAMITATWKKTTSKVGGKNKNGSVFVLEERANYKTSWLCGFNKASQRAWSRVRFGVQRMWVVSFSVHKQAVSVHPGTPQYTQRGRIVAVTSTNKLLCDSLAPLTLLKQTRALCPFFRAPLSEHLTIFKPSKRDLYALWVLYPVFLCYSWVHIFTWL